jgi:hypothetical protein
VVSFTPLPLYPQGKSSQYPLTRRLGGPQNWSRLCGEEKILDPTRTPNSDPSVVQPVASRYTDYAILAPILNQYRPKLNLYDNSSCIPNFIKICSEVFEMNITSPLCIICMLFMQIQRDYMIMEHVQYDGVKGLYLFNIRRMSERMVISPEWRKFTVMVFQMFWFLSLC